MIPQRVKLQGFLSYNDEQEIQFHDSSLWMLAGLNGSGKSSIFDAVTYALFGHHRGGSQHAIELINKDSDGLVVEFEFLLDRATYRIRRTLKRNPRGNASATQQVWRREANGDSEPGWKAIEGTRQRREFDAWVQENIGLTYDTFTSSVLLLQGKAEKLLDSTSKGRFEVLAGIVDLERYERLHRRADEERKLNDDRLKGLVYELERLPKVTAIEIAEAEARITASEAARDQAQSELDRLQGLEFQARQWVDLQARSAVAHQRWQQARHLLADAPAIERDMNRLRELRDFLPRLQIIHEQHQQIRDSERKAAELQSDKEKRAAQFAQQDHALEQARRLRATLQDTIRSDEQHHREIAGQLRQVVLQMERLKEFERQDADLARLLEEMAGLPADPSRAVLHARETHDHLNVLDRALPLLTRLQAKREELRDARTREQGAVQARQAVQTRGEQHAAEAARLKPCEEEAARTLQHANDQATSARTLLQQARESLREVTELDGAKVCRYCGQNLTPGHLEHETGRRRKAVAEADARLQAASVAQQKALREEQALRDQLAAVEKKRQDAREEFREQRSQAEQARKDLERLQAECGQSYSDLAEPFRTRVSPTLPTDWLAATYPTPVELDQLRQQAARLVAARQDLRKAEEVQLQWTKLKVQENDRRQALTRLQSELPKDRQALRQNHIRLETEEQSLDRNLVARRAEAVETQKQVDRLTRDREQTQQQLAEIKGRLSTQEAARLHCQQALARARKDLPPAWQTAADKIGLADLHGWGTERDALVKSQTDERGQQLNQARAGLQLLEQDYLALEAQQSHFPAEARQEPARIQSLLQAARQLQRTREDELAQARQHRVQLESYRQKYQELEQEKLRAEREHNSQKLLADLLGRERLQLHLVRQAERQVVDYANAALDRLSGGQLCLRLCGEAGGEGNSAKAMELEAYNRTSGDKPINVAFLSGSQKFRVAVSLALGIGQYASRQHRPIESVIIDEGFGCLDRQGRQVMIQELQNLRGQMRCILLVSHQEEFAEAFADGYRFELNDGMTKVTRFQR